MIHPPNHGDGGTGGGNDGGGPGSDSGTPDSGTTYTFIPVGTSSAVAKVKNLLTGLPATDADVASVATGGAAALKTLIQGWIATPAGETTANVSTLTPYQAKMLAFFDNAFQQTQVQPAQFQSNNNNFAGGGNTVNLMLQNQEQMFGLTTLQLAVLDKQPFTNVITTRSFMMTPALMAYYAMIDTQITDDTGRITDTELKANPSFTFKLTASGPIPLAESLDAGSPNYLTFYYPGIPQNSVPQCAATDPWVYTNTNPFRNRSVTNGLYAFLFGSVDPVGIPGGSDGGDIECKPSLTGNYQPNYPYFENADFETWSLVTIRPPSAGEQTLRPFDMITMRSTPSSIVLNTPRVSYFSTPAFFADWATNSSNQARVTMNQTMIVGLGAAFDGTNAIAPQSLAALDSAHAPQNSACFGCHQTLDPMRQFFRQTYSLSFSPQTDAGQIDLPGQFAFAPVSVQGTNILDLATQISQHPLFAAAWVQKLCTYAASAVCDENDPEFQRLVNVFQTSHYDWNTLVAELFSSPIITFLSETQTSDTVGETFPLSRQAHLCALLSVRLGINDVCGLEPTTVVPSGSPLQTVQTIVSSMPSDQFSRGSTVPVLANDPTLFFRAGLENMCLNIAQEVVDNPKLDGGGYSSSNSTAAIQDFVTNVMGLTSDRSGPALQILQGHFANCQSDGGANTSEALKSTLALACMSPWVAGVGQ